MNSRPLKHFQDASNLHEAIARRRSSGGSNNAKTPTNEDKNKPISSSANRMSQQDTTSTQNNLQPQQAHKSTSLKEQESMQVHTPYIQNLKLVIIENNFMPVIQSLK